jgi:hypothetical protein
MSVPYERIVQWTAGPVAVVAGWGATWLEANVGILNQFPKTGVAKGITEAVTFLVGAGVTYAAHHKWLDNLSKWWSVLPRPAVLGAGGALPPSSPEDIAAEVTSEIARMTMQDHAATQLQQEGASPPDIAPDHALAPSPVAAPVAAGEPTTRLAT